MTDDRLAAARAGLAVWSQQSDRTFTRFVEIMEAPADEIEREPAALLPYLEQFFYHLPLDQLEEGDWVPLRVQLVSWLARHMAVDHDVQWAVVEDATIGPGFRYVLMPPGPQARWVDPFAVVARELTRRPIDVTRMIIRTELAAGVAS